MEIEQDVPPVIQDTTVCQDFSSNALWENIKMKQRLRDAITALNKEVVMEKVSLITWIALRYGFQLYYHTDNYTNHYTIKFENRGIGL